MPRYILALLTLLVSGTVLAADVREVDLTRPTRRLPYQSDPHLHFASQSLLIPARGTASLVLDIDGDGHDDALRGNQGYVAAHSDRRGASVTYYQTNLPPRFHHSDHPSFAIALPGDLDGDGEVDLTAVGHTRDHMEWGFWILDPRTGAIKGHFVRPAFPDLREDGKWDGYYTVAGAIDVPVDDGERRALVVGVNIGFDLEGRGVMAIDPWTGEMIWHHRTGPNPLTRSIQVADLDRDGTDEIVFVGRSPHNLGGRKVNGFSDDETILFVLDVQGRLEWARRLGGWYGNGHQVIQDLDGDGALEIVTTAQSTPDIWGEIVIWSHDGQALVRYETDQQFQGHVLMPPGEDGVHALVVQATNDQILLFDCTRQSLDLRARATFDAIPFLNGVLDVLPEPGPELVASSRDGNTWVLDRNLEPLAVHVGESVKSVSGVNMMRSPDRSDLMVFTDRNRASLYFYPTPRRPIENPLVVAPSLLALASLVVVGARRLARRPRLDQTTLREVRLSLLEDLELSGHGAMAPLRSLRRFLWNLGALESNLGDRDKVMGRVKSTWRDCTDDSLPHLRGILDRARVAGLAKDNVRYAERVLDRIADSFTALAAADFTGPDLEARTAPLTVDTARADDALQDLRREVAEIFRTSLKDQLTRALRANEEGLEAACITVKTGFLSVTPAGSGGLGDVGAEPEHCLIDPAELGFVLDNLIGNAIRAMEGAPVRNLRITWSAIDGMLVTDFEDTGRGIPEEDLGRILDTRYTTREGGGRGLPRSRKILRKYGGSLVVHSSEPGRGSTLRLALPLA